MTDEGESDLKAIHRTVKRRLSYDPDRPEGAEIEVLAYVPMLWSGWECDSAAVLYRILPDGEPRLYVLDGVHVPSDRLLETLQERLAAYEKAIVDTRAFITKAKGQPDPSEWRWCCTACHTEGRGDEPDGCPTCGATNAWYNYRTMIDDTQPAMERLRSMLFPETKAALSILDRAPDVPPDPGDEVPDA
jgi:hypothetical protein